MPDGLRVQLLGGDHLAATAAAAARDLDDLSGASRQAGAQLARAAAAAAPRRTGALAGSVRAVDAGPAGVTVQTGVRYATYVEFGTRWTRPTYFLTRTLTGQADPVTDTYAAAVDHAVAKVKGQ